MGKDLSESFDPEGSQGSKRSRTIGVHPAGAMGELGALGRDIQKGGLEPEAVSKVRAPRRRLTREQGSEHLGEQVGRS